MEEADSGEGGTAPTVAVTGTAVAVTEEVLACAVRGVGVVVVGGVGLSERIHPRGSEEQPTQERSGGQR